MSLGRAASYEQVCLFKACAEIMIGQETKWPIPRNAKTHPVVAFRRRARAFAVLIVRGTTEIICQWGHSSCRGEATSVQSMSRDAGRVPLLYAGSQSIGFLCFQDSSKTQAEIPSRRLRFIRRLKWM